MIGLKHAIRTLKTAFIMNSRLLMILMFSCLIAYAQNENQPQTEEMNHNLSTTSEGVYSDSESLSTDSLKTSLSPKEFDFFKDSLNGLNDNPLAEDLALANTLYAFNRMDEAKALYLTLAKKGSAEAYYCLGYKFEWDKGDRQLNYLITAANKGHAKALEACINSLFYHRRDFTRDPVKALALYQAVKTAHPNLKLTFEAYGWQWNDEDDMLKTLEIAASIPRMDTIALFKTFKFDKTSMVSDYWTQYSIWELAERVSKHDSEEGVSSEEILQMVIQGGGEYFEINTQIQNYYTKMKLTDELVEFNICPTKSEFIQGHNQGYEYCLLREELELKKQTKTFLTKEVDVMKLDAILSERALSSFEEYLTLKLREEDQRTCSGDFYEILIQNAIRQRQTYLNLLKDLNKQKRPKLEKTLEENDKELNQIYRVIVTTLNEKEVGCNRFVMRANDIREIQLLWIKYRDENANLFEQMSSETNRFWRNYLTAKRVESLTNLKEFIDLW